MRRILSAVIVLLMALTITVEAIKTKDKKIKDIKVDGQCAEWVYQKCVPTSGDCGPGVREATCKDQTKKFKCKIPCNWKKNFGADCKYKFARWGECDAATGNRSRSGTLKKAMFNLYCQPNITVHKPCTPKPPNVKNPERKGKKGKEN